MFGQFTKPVILLVFTWIVLGSIAQAQAPPPEPIPNANSLPPLPPALVAHAKDSKNPENLLEIYANERETSDMFAKQLNLETSLMNSLRLHDTPYWMLFWYSYGGGRDFERSIMSGEDLKEMLAKGPRHMHKTYRADNEWAIKKLLQDKKKWKQRIAGGKYIRLNGSPVLWAVMDRTTPMKSVQRLLFPRISSWPPENEVDIRGHARDYKVTELTRLKIYAFDLQLIHWYDEEGVLDELLRRYHAIKPETKEMLVFKEQLRATLKKRQGNDPRVKPLPDRPLNEVIADSKKKPLLPPSGIKNTPIPANTSAVQDSAKAAPAAKSIAVETMGKQPEGRGNFIIIALLIATAVCLTAVIVVKRKNR